MQDYLVTATFKPTGPVGALAARGLGLQYRTIGVSALRFEACTQVSPDAPLSRRWRLASQPKIQTHDNSNTRRGPKSRLIATAYRTSKNAQEE